MDDAENTSQNRQVEWNVQKKISTCQSLMLKAIVLMGDVE